MCGKGARLLRFSDLHDLILLRPPQGLAALIAACRCASAAGRLFPLRGSGPSLEMMTHSNSEQGHLACIVGGSLHDLCCRRASIVVALGSPCSPGMS